MSVRGKLIERLLIALRAQLTIDDVGARLVDPQFPALRRNRTNAELLRALVRDPAAAGRCGFSKQSLMGICNSLLQAQKPSGAWHEIHPRYDAPSAMATAFMGLSLAEYNYLAQNEDVNTSIGRACDYVLEKELGPGFFEKSQHYKADFLNADAAAGAFLAQASVVLRSQAAEAAARRALANVRRHQFPDGAWPYTTAEVGAPFEFPLNVRCIHYQGVTAYYLMIANAVLCDSATAASLSRGRQWLYECQLPTGAFDWSKSELLFSRYLTGAYAFASVVFASDPSGHHGERELHFLEQMVPNLAWRWERPRPKEAFRDFRQSAKIAINSAPTIRTRGLQLGYACYRELARRRTAEPGDFRVFNLLQRFARIRTSTIEPFGNYRDLFMSTEMVDALTFQAR